MHKTKTGKIRKQRLKETRRFRRRINFHSTVVLRLSSLSNNAALVHFGLEGSDGTMRL